MIEEMLQLRHFAASRIEYVVISPSIGPRDAVVENVGSSGRSSRQSTDPAIDWELPEDIMTMEELRALSEHNAIAVANDPQSYAEVKTNVTLHNTMWRMDRAKNWPEKTGIMDELKTDRDVRGNLGFLQTQLRVVHYLPSLHKPFFQPFAVIPPLPIDDNEEMDTEMEQESEVENPLLNGLLEAVDATASMHEKIEIFYEFMRRARNREEMDYLIREIKKRPYVNQGMQIRGLSLEGFHDP
ncbi:hypothetical protein L596_025853 [Steinernema carpocapsae]|uniref:Uncharacterized protein n=1 Tax=Steinernema carpocapsae TaxID=34508 RepID=A0A4U5M916_STECR|nr:hypothetical protein L596_025853 [Steinernema carpocapsae]